jgi:hypothetical protein
VAYFQQGVSNFLLGDFEKALTNFNDALAYLRGNDHIDYEQLGLSFQLYSCEIMFNRGLCYIYLQQKGPGMQDLINALKEKRKLAHDVINDAIKDKAVVGIGTIRFFSKHHADVYQGYTVFSILVGVIFRPHEAKVRNIFARDYLGKATLVATTVPDPGSGSGYKRTRAASVHGFDRNTSSSDGVSYSATNLVKPELQDRNRQQSEPPPMRRPLMLDDDQDTDLPPTPPLKAFSEQATSKSTKFTQSRSQSVPRGQEPLEHETTHHTWLPPRSQSLERPDILRSTSGQLPRSSETPGGSSSHRRIFSLSLRPKRSRPALGLRTQSLDVPSTTVIKSAEDNQPISANSSIRRNFKQRPDSIEEEDEGMTDILSAMDGWSPAAAKEREQRRSGSHLRRFSLRSRNTSLDRTHNPARSQPQTLTPLQSRPKIMLPMITTIADIQPTIRLKVHYGDDTRYIILSACTTFEDLSKAIAKKFKLNGDAFVMTTRDDDGDLITMADQDDLEASYWVSVEVAKGGDDEKEHGRLEVWVSKA